MRILCLIIIMLLAGCQTTHQVAHEGNTSSKHKVQNRNNKSINKKLVSPSANYLKNITQNNKKNIHDSAPKGPIPTAFQRVNPKSEPMSRFGNPSEYRVNGKTYEVLTTAKGYRARGTASWYGTKFHQRRTSSGEDYDLYALTAAHKTLPLPTYVRVKNLNNGKVAIVKVNDRGPFHNDRIIDLSYGAAAKLGILPAGTAPVEIEALSINGGRGHVAHYYLQAGAFSSENFAKSLRQKLTKVTSSPVFIEKYKQYFIVKAGPFVNKQMAESVKVALARMGISGSFSVIQ